MKLMLYNTSGKNTVYKNIGYFDNSGSYRKNVKILGLGNSLYLKEKSGLWKNNKKNNNQIWWKS
ncbi:hypothetical protein NW064_00180 [Mycoplasmopsis felis]|uniref:hypothetical protein n=1 Tax=Mycoplasmopsis felis TaxID=33923 RepID=UPI0021B01AD5|nr:hypothetical protein [Mycoplasmopsis felis]UWW00902.1 hypothetical protein NW064_00180 [Mycoplasmopsis felis]